MAEYTYTVQGSDFNRTIEGSSFNNVNGTLEIYDDTDGLKAVFAPGSWGSVEAEKTEARKDREKAMKDQSQAQVSSDDQALADRGLDTQQNYADKSAKGENPTLGNPDPRAINGDVETGEADETEDGKDAQKSSKSKASK